MTQEGNYKNCYIGVRDTGGVIYEGVQTDALTYNANVHGLDIAMLSAATDH